MRVIARKTLRVFVESLKGHKDQAAVEAALDAWFREVSHAAWSSSADVRQHHATASIISADRVVFNIKGNDYRLIVRVDYGRGVVWILWIGTHKDYDKIDARTVRYAR